MHPGLQVRALGVVLGLAAVLVSPAAGQRAGWLDPEAPVRYRVELFTGPTHESCGYFVHLPDGGILPNRTPLTRVFTPDGTPVPSYLLWYNRISGMALVFADPGNVDEVVIYVRGTTQPKYWKPESGLTPSAILCVNPTTGSLLEAKKLSQLGSVNPSVHYRNKAGIRIAPLSVGDDDTGRPRPGSYYLLSHVNTTKPGQTWIAPFTLEGQNEVQVNGKVLVPEKRIDKWGGTGQYFDLPAGLNRIEVFATAPGTGPYAYAIPEESEAGKKKPAIDSKRPKGGRMYLTWRTPGATIEELGGVRSKKVSMAGSSRMETRVLRNDEIARSGSVQLRSIEARTGGPVASITAEATQNYWFEGEAPLLLYRFSANTMGHPKGTKYIWEFEGGARLEGPYAEWLVPGFREHKVTLTVLSQRGRSKAVYPFYGFAQVKSSLNYPDDRREYRRVCLKTLKAYPPQANPTASWTSAQWNNLFRTLDFGKGYYLLEHLFGKRWNRARPGIANEKLAQLEDIFLDVAAGQNPAGAMKWARSFGARAPNAARRNELKLREAEIAMFYEGQTNGLSRVLQGLARGGGEAGDRAMVRLGDLALLQGNLNLATKYYAEVQNRVRSQRNRSSAGPSAGDGAVNNWKLHAFLEVSAAEHVKGLMEQDYLIEAQQTLRDWERMFPLSKISGDYILQESHLYAKVGNYRRIRRMLEAYVNQVDASSFLPEAAALLLDCMVELKVPGQEIRTYCEKMKERLKFHPVAEKFDPYL